MTPVLDDAASERQNALFGAIIQCFAQHEALIDEALAKVSGASPTAVKLLTADVGFAQKCDALLGLMRHLGLPVAQYDRVLRFLAAPRTYLALRHDIIHSVWTRSASPNVIYPKWLSHGPVEAVRPVHNLPGSDAAFAEGPKDSAVYALDDLDGVGQLLARNYRDFTAYLAEHALISAIPA